MPEHFKLLFESHVVIVFSFFFNLGNKLITINIIISLWNHYKIIIWIKNVFFFLSLAIVFKETIVDQTLYI